MKKTRLTAFLLASILSIPALAEVKLPRLFSSHMVLQREKTVPVWGTADPNEKVSVELVGMGKKPIVKTVKADKNGDWKVQLEAHEAGGPYVLTVKGKSNTVTLDDVLFGDVWICSGQSNMQWTVNASRDPEKERAAANYPMIRHFSVPRQIATTPKKDITNGTWEVTNPSTVGEFTAVGYFFARELYNELNIPIGLINTSWGGTFIEPWISKEGMASLEEFKEVVNTLPKSVDEINETKRHRLNEVILAEQGGYPDASEVATFSNATFDDSKWQTINLPRNFDASKFTNFDGAVWFRKTVELPQATTGKALLLGIGTVNDKDVVYFNGVRIGEGQATGERWYDVPANLVKAGRNVIAVRVEDVSGPGGISGKPEKLVLINSAVQLSLADEWKYRIEYMKDNKQFAGPNDASTLLYNSMIHPLIQYPIKGGIWYQGESNAGRAYQYRKAFPLLISDWRKKWSDDFPFYFVQLASFEASGGNSQKGSTWAELREAQTLTLSVPKTGMAVIHDIGEAKDIHPRNKQDVGKRLALNALSQTYGKKVTYASPLYKSMKVEDNAVALSFDYAEQGFKVVDPYGYVKGFEIAGADQKFYPAKAEINGSQVVVWSDEVSKPVAVRYGWSDDNIEANLFNSTGLPVAPFRTDSWPGVTDKNVLK